MGQLRPFIYFCLFKHTLQSFTTNICEKCSSSIECQNLNSRPLEHESPPITTRPRLPAHNFSIILLLISAHNLEHGVMWPFLKGSQRVQLYSSANEKSHLCEKSAEQTAPCLSEDLI